MSLRRIVTVAAASLVLLTGCGASGDAFAPAMDSAAGGAAYSSEGAGSAAEPADADKAAADSVASDYLVREAWLGLKVDSVTEAAAQARVIATDAQGSVLREEFGDGGYYGEPGGGDGIDRYGTMTVSVPSKQLEATLAALSELGEVRTRSSNSVDVKDEYIDVEARIATLTASIERMRDLMAQTADIDQIVKLETALSQRQADLDSLQARMNALRSSIDMSPITLTLTTTDDLGGPDSSFVTAVKDGWHDFQTSAAVLVRVVAALLPWIVVGGLALWAALWATRRWRTRRHRPTRTPSPAATPAPTRAPEQPKS